MFEDLAWIMMRVFAVPVEYFNIILEATGTAVYLITAFIIYSLVRFIFLPFLGNSIINGSDRAKPERHDHRERYYNPHSTRYDRSYNREWND